MIFYHAGSFADGEYHRQTTTCEEGKQIVRLIRHSWSGQECNSSDTVTSSK